MASSDLLGEALLDLDDIGDGIKSCVEDGEALGCIDIGSEEVLEISSNVFEDLDLSRGALSVLWWSQSPLRAGSRQGGRRGGVPISCVRVTR